MNAYLRTSFTSMNKEPCCIRQQLGNVNLFQYLVEKKLKYLNKCGQNWATLFGSCYGRVKGDKCFVIDNEYPLYIRNKSSIPLLQQILVIENSSHLYLDIHVDTDLPILQLTKNNTGISFNK